MTPAQQNIITTVRADFAFWQARLNLAFQEQAKCQNELATLQDFIDSELANAKDEDYKLALEAL